MIPGRTVSTLSNLSTDRRYNNILPKIRLDRSRNVTTRSGCKPYNLYTRTREEHIDRGRCNIYIVIVVYNVHICFVYVFNWNITDENIDIYEFYSMRIVYLISIKKNTVTAAV